MKCLLITTVLVLFFCQHGNAITCYNCKNYKDTGKCETTRNCPAGLDACIVVEGTFGNRSILTARCWRSSECDRKYLETEFKTVKFKHRCCQKDLCNTCEKDLCNTCPILAGSKTVLGATSLLTVIWMLWK